MEENKAFKIFMNPTSNAGVVYYRMVNFANWMSKQKNVSVAYSRFDPMNQMGQPWELALEFEPYAQKFGLTREKILDDIDMLMDVCDISIWQPAPYPSSHALFRAYRDKYDRKKPIVMEVDDYLFAINPESQAFDSFYPNSNPEYFAEMQLRNSNYVIVSTNWLKDGDGVFEGLKKYNANVECIPNSIDFDIWDKLTNQKQKDKITIGWAGGGAHYNDLKVIDKVIPAILSRHKNVHFMFFGYMPDYIKEGPRVKHWNRWYSIYDYPKHLADLGFDIGIAPLNDNLFNRAKSNLRWLEYSALKVPTVASPRIPFQECENLLLAEEPEEWIEELSLLITDQDKRIEMGEKAYNEVKQKFNIKKTASKYLTVLKEIHTGKRKTTVARYDEAGNPFVTV